MAAYCTPAQFILCYDIRRINELASDTGEPITDPTQDDNVDAALNQGEQDFLQAARQSNRYTIAMLDEIYASVTRRYNLIAIISAFAFTRLVARRGLAESELGELSPLYNQALQTREAFLDGRLILDDVNGLVAAAGVTVKIVPLSPNVCSWTANNRLFGAGCGCFGTVGSRNR